ncbi:hypothetical protein NOVOSPHI9U_630068 [Novosphingobium sp. 9U]|nr:hypothetical protein NOVOSPHI9U_630068 [Novosphingobium sp. 9U]
MSAWAFTNLHEALTLRSNPARDCRPNDWVRFSGLFSRTTDGRRAGVGHGSWAPPTAIGTEPLRRERSRKLGGGVVLTPDGGSTRTADVFSASSG